MFTFAKDDFASLRIEDEFSRQKRGNDWQREVKASVGDLVFAEVADYDVTIATPPNVALFTSGETRTTEGASRRIAGASSSFIVLALPKPELTPRDR